MEKYLPFTSKIKIQKEKVESAMKETKVEKILLSIAKTACESTSCIGLYEPKIPEELIKKESKKEQ